MINHAPTFGKINGLLSATCTIESKNPQDITAKWVDQADWVDPDKVETNQREDVDELLVKARELIEQVESRLQHVTNEKDAVQLQRDMRTRIHPMIKSIQNRAGRDLLAREIADFVIYNLNALALRGIQVTSRKEPLGINGENLDVLISTFPKKELDELVKRSRLVSWLDSFFVDPADALKFQGHKLGRSISTLYFRDRFMRQKGNVFSAENANEGILHVLFYLALFISPKTPKFFGIDNIETALNPRLCRKIITEIVDLAAKHDKQVLLTTHNPATLDGLDLHDDAQRLFVVYRNNQGHTVTKRIKLKPKTGESQMPLSELWMRGHLGGIPKQF